ncbi:MAG TPA: hypothetical protein VM599_00875 [Thermoanaerobaculia bacterium]|nr:hypothetical protein [Thermoanaerobaculia bacterium]
MALGGGILLPWRKPNVLGHGFKGEQGERFRAVIEPTWADH